MVPRSVRAVNARRRGGVFGSGIWIVSRCRRRTGSDTYANEVTPGGPGLHACGALRAPALRPRARTGRTGAEVFLMTQVPSLPAR